MPELERELAALRDHVDWPATPDFAGAVVARLRRRRTPRVLVVAVAAVALGLAVALAVPPARSALLRFFHLRGVTVERVETLPPARERIVAADFGRPVPRREAERRVGFELLLPPRFEPARVRVLDGLASVVLRRKDVSLALSEFRGTGFGLLKKVAGFATTVEPIKVNGQPGIWLSGGGHVLIFRTGSGAVERKTVRVTGNVLLWQHGQLTLRLAGPIGRDEALQFASSIR
jgi:hypothetical protein